MAVLRMKELKEMSDASLKAKIGELRKELMAERSKMSSTKTSDSPGKFKQIKKAIARIKTIAGERGSKIE